MEDLEQRIEGDEGDRPDERQHDDQPGCSIPDRGPGTRGRAGAPRAASAERDHGGGDHRHRGDREEPDEHAAHITHVRPLSFVEDRPAIQRDIEIGWTDDKVGQDGVAHGAELRFGEAGPRCRVRPSLLKGHPDRVEEQGQHEGDDRERGRHRDQERGSSAAQCLHGCIVARRGEDVGRVVFRTPVATGPAPAPGSAGRFPDTGCDRPGARPGVGGRACRPARCPDTRTRLRQMTTPGALGALGSANPVPRGSADRSFVRDRGGDHPERASVAARRSA